MIDTHIHLESEEYNADCQEVIKRFFEKGGKALVNVGVSEARMKKAQKIANSDERIFVAIGFHPQEGTDLQRAGECVNFEEILKDFARDHKVVAIGEIGLDYFHPSGKEFDLRITEEIKEVQKRLFVTQLELARKLDLPVIVHSWNAEIDCWEILSNYLDLKIVFHCYGRGIAPGFTKKLLKYENINFSFTGNVTFPKPGKSGAELFEHLKLIPLERIMVETDGPFLAPVPHRGKRNEPFFVKHIIEKIAQVKDLTNDEVEKQTDQNAMDFFNLNI
ncbi:MAG: TatD family hydrolase [Patescibacteria group bacterium]|nr:TatD family hydrolase [Patescibacteria group bacterium]